jgi:hypothetical protein
LTPAVFQGEGRGMMKCEKCQATLDKGEGRALDARTLCDDCFIDVIWPKVRKSYDENNPSEFMQRLKRIGPVHPQQYHS